MEDLEGEQDFEAFEKQQQKKELEEKELDQDGNLNRKRLHFEDEDNEGESYGEQEYGSEYAGEEDEDIERGDGGYGSDPELATAKRDYKFQGGTSRERAQSAKPKRGEFNEGNLRSQKLTTEDYAERDKSKKKGKYGVTVPRPFNFDMREKTKKRTIREQKVEEMVHEIKQEEESAVNF